MNADGNMPYDICEDDVCLDFIETEMAKRGMLNKSSCGEGRGQRTVFPLLLKIQHILQGH